MTTTHAASFADEVVPNVILAVHGGVGVDRIDMTPELDAEVRAALNSALDAGFARSKIAGATPLDVIEAAIRVMEDAPCLNAGKGAVFTHEGRNELDASIMDGKTRKAGAVASVTIVKNPISAARAVMEQSKHVMLIGRGAEVFATQKGLEIVDPSYFWTERRWKAINKIWEMERAAQKQSSVIDADAVKRLTQFGTVGAVAIDSAGNLAAGTSTGGMTNKMFGRVGDSPIIGAGTYADNDTAAISCTGHGEFFIRYAVAHEIVSQMRYGKVPMKDAAEDVINRQLKQVSGEGAAIVLGRDGKFTTAYNSEGLYRGWVTLEGKKTVRIFEE